MRFCYIHTPLCCVAVLKAPAAVLAIIIMMDTLWKKGNLNWLKEHILKYDQTDYLEDVWKQ